MTLEHQEAVTISSAVSEDGQTLEQVVSAPAFGVYDPEMQLADAEVVKLKATLKADIDSMGQLVGQLCTHIVISMLTDVYRKISDKDMAAESAKGTDPEPLIGEGGRYGNEDEYARHVGLLSVHWALGLKEAIDLPGAEWVKGMTPPATFSEALKEIEGLDYLGRELDNG